MPRNAYKWWVVAMLWFVCFFNYADRQAIFSVFPLLKSGLGLSDVQLGVVGASFMWVYALMGPIAGWLGDRFSRKGLILSGLVFWSLMTAATALSQVYWHLVLCRALEGLGEAFYFPASMSLISEYHDETTRSRAMAIHHSSVYAGTIAGGGLSGLLAQHYGWRIGFVLFGSLGALLGLALLRFLREPVRSQASVETPAWTKIRVGLKEIFAEPLVPILMGIFIGANFVAVVFLTWTPSFLYRKFGMSLSMAGLNGTAYLQIASVLGVVSGGLLADRLARRRRGGRMLVQAVALVAGAPFIFVTGWTNSTLFLIIAMAGFGYCKGLYDGNLFASLYDVVPVERRAAAAGIFNSLGWLGGGVAPVAVALASERYGMSACLSATSAIYLLSGCVLLWSVQRFAAR